MSDTAHRRVLLLSRAWRDRWRRAREADAVGVDRHDRQATGVGGAWAESLQSRTVSAMRGRGERIRGAVVRLGVERRMSMTRQEFVLGLAGALPEAFEDVDVG